MYILGLLLLTFIHAASPLSFNMSPITKSDGGRLNLTGNAYITDQGIQVTTNERDQVQGGRIGRATYTEALHLWSNASQELADFATHFSFVIDSFGDGLAFFLAPLGSSIQQWTHGGGLGLGNATAGSSPFVAVEFDTFPNDGMDPPYDGASMYQPHVGIDLNNLSSLVTATWNNNVTAGWQNDAYILYDSVTKILRVDFSGTCSNGTQWNSLIYLVDLRDYLPEYVIVGFSAGTGDKSEKHNVKSWSFSSTDVGSNQDSSSRFSAATGDNSEKHNIKSWSFSSTDVGYNQDSNLSPSPEPIFPDYGSNQDSSPSPRVEKYPMPVSHKNKTKQKKKKSLILGLSAGILVLMLVLALAYYTFCCLLPKKKKEEEVHVSDLAMDKEFEKGKRPIKFSYKELVLATDDFAENRKLGEGGFGSVYRGYLRSTNTNIAVKKVSDGSKQGRKEYASEVKIISQLRHINLVELIGWCHQGSVLLLVYEFMPNGSLDSHLFKLNSVLRWETRLRVAQGLASALLYLHEELGQYVVHRDIKASNIMLDSNFNAKLGDFGLARLVDHDKDLHSTIPAGTIGYMAPEYPVTGIASKETDVYSFGVVLLEIACGRRPIDHKFCKNQVVLVEWVWSLYGSGQLLDAADPELDSSDYDARKMERLMVVGLWCVHLDSNLRPSMRQVMRVLNSEDPLPSLPLAMPKAVFYNSNAPRVATTSSYSTTHSGGVSTDFVLTTSSAGSTSDLPPK